MIEIRRDIDSVQDREYVNTYTAGPDKLKFLMSGLFLAYITYIVIKSFFTLTSAMLLALVEAGSFMDALHLLRSSSLHITGLVSLLFGVPIILGMSYLALKNISGAFLPSLITRAFRFKNSEDYTDLTYSFSEDFIKVTKTNGQVSVYPWTTYKWYDELEHSIVLSSDQDGRFLIPIERVSELRHDILQMLISKYKPSIA